MDPASEIAKAGGLAICAPIAPYQSVRVLNRAETESKGGAYVEVHIATPLEECEKRDRKGLYAKARAGIIKGFTGIDDPYEEPVNPELKIDTTGTTPAACAEEVLSYLRSEGYLPKA